MAVERCAENFITTIEDNGAVDAESTGAATVPDDCTTANNGICIVVIGGNYDNGATALWTVLEELNWDGDNDVIDFTEIALQQDAGSNYSIGAWYMLANDSDWPGTGEKTLYYRLNQGDGSEGITIAVFFYKGVDLTDPIGDTDKGSGGDNWAATLDTPAPGVGDMAVIAATQQTSGGDIQADYGAGQGIVLESDYNSIIQAIGDELAEGTPSLDTDENGWPGYLAFGLNAAAAGGISIPLVMQQMNQFRGGGI